MAKKKPHNIPQLPTAENHDGLKIRIIVCDRGFVYVCRCNNPMESGFWLPVITKRTIRNWGTTDGLAQLQYGPTSDTVLDEMLGSGIIPVRAILDVQEVDQEAWSKYLPME